MRAGARVVGCQRFAAAVPWSSRLRSQPPAQNFVWEAWTVTDLSPDAGVRMDLSTDRRDGNARAMLRVAGEIDLDTAPQLGEMLAVVAEGANDQIVVNFEDTIFIDSSGVRALLQARSRIQHSGGSLVVDGMSPQVARVFELLGITNLLCSN
jgi:anti-sigma B factor antagonist